MFFAFFCCFLFSAFSSMKSALHVACTKSSTLPKCLTAESTHTSPSLILHQHSVLTHGHHVDRRTLGKEVILKVRLPLMMSVFHCLMEKQSAGTRVLPAPGNITYSALTRWAPSNFAINLRLSLWCLRKGEPCQRVLHHVMQNAMDSLFAAPNLILSRIPRYSCFCLYPLWNTLCLAEIGHGQSCQVPRSLSPTSGYSSKMTFIFLWSASLNQLTT